MTTLFTITIPEPKIRKKFAPKTRVVADKTKYSRKQKHKKNQD